ncbi:MAG: phosphatase PAP2 family protein [Acidimicrobiales bacterium]
MPESTDQPQSDERTAAFLSTVDRFDERIDALFEPLRAQPWANRLFYSLSAIADHSILWFIFAAFLALFPGASRRGQRAFIALWLESGIVNLVVKTIFRRERPVYDGPRPLPLRQPLTSSFPSGHATAATCAAILLSEGTASAPLLFALAGLVAISRIHVRIHHASDVIGGVVFGALFAYVVKTVSPINPSRSSVR